MFAGWFIFVLHQNKQPRLITAQDADINIAASGIWLIQLQTVATSLVAKVSTVSVTTAAGRERW